MASESTPYQPTQSLRSLLADYPKLISTLSRFGIPLGFGDKSVELVCSEAGVDADTFLAVVNCLTGVRPVHEIERVQIPGLLDYLRNSHRFFLEFILPRIRRNLIEAISTGVEGELPMMIMKFFDGFTDEVRVHMTQEETDVFSAIDDMLAGTPRHGFTIEQFSAGHQPMDAKLRELKEIFVCHYHSENPSRADLLNSVLLDIIHCERDIADHGRVEEQLLVPAVRHLEHKTAVSTRHRETPVTDKIDRELTGREREIVAAIARGLGNKQIADELCVSVHTVTTHRRNICAKLDIHSPAGLTIYALIHGIVSIDDVRP